MKKNQTNLKKTYFRPLALCLQMQGGQPLLQASTEEPPDGTGLEDIPVPYTMGDPE